jgi:Ser/Thr protein kinase RdoA (MazF antagonist)
VPDPPTDLEPLPLPAERDWAELGLRVGPALHGGRQSHVLRAEGHGRRVVIKLTDSRVTDPFHEHRMQVIEQLAERNPLVVGPVRLGSALVTHIGAWRAVAFPFIDGTTPDPTNRTHVAVMAAALASLHTTFATIDGRELPRVAALRDGGQSFDELFGDDRLLHGDFSAANVRFTESGTKVIDYDDCGRGPIEFDVGNTLYMELFDAAIDSDLGRAEQFRRWFVEAYEDAAGRTLAAAALDRAIDLRISALRRWLDDPTHAPVGIRTATVEWRRTLRTFVDTASRRPTP